MLVPEPHSWIVGIDEDELSRFHVLDQGRPDSGKLFLFGIGDTDGNEIVFRDGDFGRVFVIVSNEITDHEGH